VSDALAQRGTLVQRVDAQTALVSAADKSYRIHDARYRQGSESHLAALVAQRALYAAQQGLIGAQLEQSSNAVACTRCWVAAGSRRAPARAANVAGGGQGAVLFAVALPAAKLTNAVCFATVPPHLRHSPDID
jgi:hypothetical protein